MRTNIPKESFTNNSLIRLKDKNWLEKQRVAGKIAAETLLLLANAVATGERFTTQQLNELGEKYIEKNGGSCTFKGYKGFPAGVCISVNKEVVHGIPKDYELKNGDLVSFDLGVTIDGAIADTAITCIYGEGSERNKKLVKDTEEALMRGIQAVEAGKRLGVIGNAIHKFAKGHGYGVINNYGGHGLDWDVPHAPPFVENKSDPSQGIHIQPGLAIAIEPMLVLGSTTTSTLEDGWTVVTPDLSAHFEHSIFVHEDHVEIITDRSKL
jgi:methionyl aminopeptidase